MPHMHIHSLHILKYLAINFPKLTLAASSVSFWKLFSVPTREWEIQHLLRNGRVSLRNFNEGQPVAAQNFLAINAQHISLLGHWTPPSVVLLVTLIVRTGFAMGLFLGCFSNLCQVSLFWWCWSYCSEPHSHDLLMILRHCHFKCLPRESLQQLCGSALGLGGQRLPATNPATNKSCDLSWVTLPLWTRLPLLQRGWLLLLNHSFLSTALLTIVITSKVLLGYLSDPSCWRTRGLLIGPECSAGTPT